ncbi:MAG TPA: putative glycoside hydrolase, partial [Candidatus Parcubacteria bacterium]|nr:putative glycoside hydrolase [Candidatus Parcubacteria bacterium]
EKLLIEEAVKEAQNRSNDIKSLYMTEFVASSEDFTARQIRENITNILEKSELNGLVIDVKETSGLSLPFSLKTFINNLKEDNVWVIARIVVFRDCSLIENNSELYLKTKEAEIWRDWSGECWLDPSSLTTHDYLIELSKKVIDFGFDELQFDYIRFPSDGDLEDIVYPFYDKEMSKSKVIQEFSLKLSQELKSYQPEIILSVDLFGYVATQFNAFSIGQRLSDFSDNFDYISFMLYPSHFYGGFIVEEDLKRGLPALNFPYQSEDPDQVVSNRPYEIISRSIFSALDYLSLFESKAKIRPWLQGFNLSYDVDRGILYNAEKIQAQFKAAEESGASGWMIWNSANIYSEKIFQKEK